MIKKSVNPHPEISILCKAGTCIMYNSLPGNNKLTMSPHWEVFFYVPNDSKAQRGCGKGDKHSTRIIKDLSTAKHAWWYMNSNTDTCKQLMERE